MKKLIMTTAVTIALSACTAQMKVKNTLTERGYVATSDYQIGQILHWIPDQDRLLAIDVLSKSARSTKHPSTLRVNLKTDVEFSGGVSLTEGQKADLVSEVTSRTSTVLENSVTHTIDGLVSAIDADWDARPQHWRTELGIEDQGWPADGKPIYVALVYRQTFADKLHVEVDRQSAVGGVFTSVATKKRNLKFKLVDAASVELVGVGGRTPTYYELALIRIRNTPTGPKFSRRAVPTEVEAQLVKHLTR